MRNRYVFGACCVALLLANGVAAEPSEEELAKRSQNPVANMISVPFENSLHFDVGPTDKLANVLTIKPVIPVSLGKFNLINRFIAPVIWLEGQDRVTAGRGGEDFGFGEVFPGTSSEFGLGNLTYQGFFSPAEPGPVIWGVGPTLVLPTNTDDKLGSDTWSAGISTLVLAMPGKWVVGALVQNTWSFAKHGDAPDQNSFLVQPIMNYNMSNGWYLSSTPVITANWEADSGDKWTVPVGGGVGRLLRMGNQPIDLRLAAFYNVERPALGPRWTAQFTVKLLFPK
ncbi:MAG: neuromedin U [Deltaproteobacteria bacterium]|nr:neuromedin U [Deltaproteobacteria bacterium]MBW2394012.1 neuromedin U [Deltaproteobacteria bacterium]